MKTALLILALTLTLGCATAKSAEKSIKGEHQTEQEKQKSVNEVLKFIVDAILLW